MMLDSIPRARPDPNTYWVIEGRFLAGEYPGARDPVKAREKVAAFRKAGIKTFIDLTEAHELAPYEPLLANAGAEYHRFPIRDVSVSREARYMHDILDAIDTALAAGRNVYVHCWGGIGRTGTVVACWLQRHGRNPDEALQELARLWQNMAKRHRQPRSPETDEQIAWVRNWPSMGNTKDSGGNKVNVCPRPFPPYRIVTVAACWAWPWVMPWAPRWSSSVRAPSRPSTTWSAADPLASSPVSGRTTPPWRSAWPRAC